MPVTEASARKWRDRAEELRVVASAARDPHARQSLLAMAENWERMAVWAERASQPAPPADSKGTPRS